MSLDPSVYAYQLRMISARRLLWAELAMKKDMHETAIAAASMCHGYFVRDHITTGLLAALDRIGSEAK